MEAGNITTKWEPDNFELQMTTVWSFPERGDWATHNAKYRGNWSPYIPRNIILRYSKENDIVLDQFVGSGTTMVETKLLNRKGIGIDINPVAIEITREHLKFQRPDYTHFEPKILLGDARNLSVLSDESVDLVCTHPPYANIIQYSEDVENDLSHLELKFFIPEMEKVAKESYRVLKKNKFCAILIGDSRKNGHMQHMGFDVLKVFETAGFKLKETIIKEQHNCKATGYWKMNSVKYNFLLIAHEYLFVFRK